MTRDRLANLLVNLLSSSSIFRHFASLYMYKVAYNGKGSDQCLKLGYLPINQNFDSPIPNFQDLVKRQVWDKRSYLPGLDFRAKEQVKLLSLLGNKFGNECIWPMENNDNSGSFYTHNPSFSFGCAALLYCMIRELKPARIVEIGSGQSSKVISQAVAANNKTTEHLIIDPYPEMFIINKNIRYGRLIKASVQTVPVKIFSRLNKNDILFIDSSHVVKTGSDVNYLILEILPRLKKGVFVHFHDISLPYDYPSTYATREVSRQFWTEQYLLQSFLIFNDSYEIVLAGSWLMRSHKNEFARAFPHYDVKIHSDNTGSFWIMKK